MKKAHKQKLKKLKKRIVSAKPPKLVKPIVNIKSRDSVVTAVLDQLNGGADEATRELRALTRTKDETIQHVLVKSALDNVFKGALNTGRHNESGGGRAAILAAEKPAEKTKTETVGEHKEEKPMSVAHAEEHAINGSGIANTGVREVGGVHELGLNGSSKQEEKLKRFPTLIGRRPGQKVIHWNHDEKAKMARAIVDEMMACGVGQIPTEDDRAGARLLLDCARRAQGKVMPPDRRRKLSTSAEIVTNGIVSRLPEVMKQAQAEREAAVNAEARAKLLGLDKKVEEPAKPVEPPPAPPVHVARTEIPPLSAEELADPILAAANGLILALRVQFKEMKELRGMYELMIEDLAGLRKRVEASEEHVRVLEKVERKADGQAKAQLPVVAILGCRKDQFDEIETRAKERGLNLVFRHYDQDSNPRPINAQWAVSMRFVRHSWDDQVNASIPRGNYSFIRGGVSQVVQQLEIWFGGNDQQV